MAGKRKHRLLMIDSSDARRRSINMDLFESRLCLSEARDEAEGLRMAIEHVPDMILLDGSIGMFLVRRLQSDPFLKSIPIIVMADYNSPEIVVQSLNFGAVDALIRPYSGEELRARVKAALQTYEQIEYWRNLAYRDGLTGLANRLALDERLIESAAQCGRRGTPLAVLFADLDRFKTINDEHGHTAGDEVLRQAARVIRDTVRLGDFVARYGGEEFVIIAPDSDADGAMALGERCREAVAAMCPTIRSRPLKLTTSVGVAVAPAEHLLVEGPLDLLRMADDALYRAKASGRDTVRLGTLDPEEEPTEAMSQPAFKRSIIRSR